MYFKIKLFLDPQYVTLVYGFFHENKNNKKKKSDHEFFLEIFFGSVLEHCLTYAVYTVISLILRGPLNSQT